MVREHWNTVPTDGMEHLPHGGCWCQPKVSTDPSNPNVTWYEHKPNAPVETPNDVTPEWLAAIQREQEH